MPFHLLENINSPEDLKNLDINKLPQLAQEIRDYLIEVTSQNGGHLGSNLGVVELTLAMHKVFDSPKDRFLFDVSHQGYVHKILTGRRDYLKTLRQTKGCSGFLQREESAHDAFGAGHAGTAFSAGLGFAAARDVKGTDEHVISVIGDGAFGCGVSLEALNNVAETTKKMIVVLNDNKMSISPNVGALSKHFNKLISDKKYKDFKHGVGDMIEQIPRVGSRIREGLSKLDEHVKGLVTPSTIFEEMGLKYYGPIDGHDVHQLIDIFESIKDTEKPVLLHIVTEKGKGFDGASIDPEKCHGFKQVKAINVSEVSTPEPPGGPSFSDAFGQSICRLATDDERVVGISAGMISGTGMTKFSKLMPSRCYDVGIAEEHAAIFAGGMAANGLRPIASIYATFMQRAMDCVLHDVCLQELPVLFCMDRAGFVEDGPTHHGISDISFWQTLPNLNIMQPRDASELEEMMRLSLQLDFASVIRYPKAEATDLNVPRAELKYGKSEVVRAGKDAVIWASGREVQTALQVADLLSTKGIEVKVVNPRFLAPFDSVALQEDSKYMPVISLEDHMINGGLGSLILNTLNGAPAKGLLRKGWPNEIIPWGKAKDIRRDYRLTPELIAEDIETFIQNGSR